MYAKLHLLSQDDPAGGAGLRWRAHPYLRLADAVPRGPSVFDWNARQRTDLEALWRDPDSDGARERLAGDLAAFCERLGWTPDAAMLEDAEAHGDEYLVTLSAVPAELYLLPWEVIRVGAAGTYLSDYASAQVRYAVPGLEPRATSDAPAAPGVLFAWSEAGGAVPHDEQGAAIRAAADAGGVAFRELAGVDEASLQAALDAGPPSVLHLLCHGAQGPEGEPPRLRCGASDSPAEITATRLARMLRRHSDAIRLVVLSACGSGDGRGDPLFVGSMAQELHRKGIPNVVASRYPLSVRGAQVLTRALYDKMLREAWSLERALRHTRAELFRAGADGKSYPGDAYGIQLYAHDTERFVSDNDVEAERPVLASYPFGTAARPVPSREPPPAELTLNLDGEAAVADDQLVEQLRRVSEDGALTLVIKRAGEREISLKVRTTVDGGQRLLDAWRSKRLQVAVGAVVATLILTKGLEAMAAVGAGAASQPVAGAASAGEAAATSGQAASAGQAGAAGQAASAGQAAATAGKAAAVHAAKSVAVLAGKAITAKAIVAIVVGGIAVASAGVAVLSGPTTAADRSDTGASPNTAEAPKLIAANPPGPTTSGSPPPSDPSNPATPTSNAGGTPPTNIGGTPPTNIGGTPPTNAGGTPPSNSGSPSTSNPSTPTTHPSTPTTNPRPPATPRPTPTSPSGPSTGPGSPPPPSHPPPTRPGYPRPTGPSTTPGYPPPTSPPATTPDAPPATPTSPDHPPATTPPTTDTPPSHPGPTVPDPHPPGTGSPAAPSAVCGNGNVESGEQCDDGNARNGDGCAAACRFEWVDLPPPDLESLRSAGATEFSLGDTWARMVAAGAEPASGSSAQPDAGRLVVVELCISTAGTMTKGKVRKPGTGKGAHDSALLNHLRSWRYRPYVRDGAALPACSTVNFTVGAR